MSFHFNSISGVPGHAVYGHNVLVRGEGGTTMVRGGYARCSISSQDHLRPDHFTIFWQDGPCNREDGEKPNGAFVEDLLKVCRIRLEEYQKTPFCCQENDDAIQHLTDAIEVLSIRRDDRAKRGVLGKDEK